MFRGHGLFNHGPFAFLRRFQLRFEIRDHAIGKLARLGEVAIPFGDFQL